jgi:hypothetical protein
MTDQLQYKRVPDVDEGQNPWFHIDRLEAWLHGEKVGFIRAAWLKRCAFEEGGRFSDLLGYVAYAKGECRVQKYVETGSLRECMSGLSASYLPWRVHCDVDWENEDQETLRKYFSKVFDRIREKHIKGYESARAQAGKPYVDFVRVNTEWRRRGVGTDLYVRMARWLAESDMALHSSGIQTDEAQAAWESFARKVAAFKIVKGVFSSKRYALDYRDL